MGSRRDFIRSTGLGIAGLAMAPYARALGVEERQRRITILHTNDVHSHIDPFPVNDPKYPNLGGFARRAALIRKIRQETEHVLLLDAGDIFQGTPYFNYYGGELEFKLMSEMKYDAATIGNHDFDNGIDGLLKQLPHASFPFVNVNYDFSDTELSGKISRYVIIKRGGIKTGIFGVGVELEGLVDKRLYKETRYQDPVDVANQTAKHLKEDLHCDLVICLSHLGYEYESKKISDKVLASSTRNIDVIIGGHTHTFLDQPVEIKNTEGNKVIVNQVGWAGVNLGRIDLVLDPFVNGYSMESRLYEISKKTIGL